MKDPFNEINPVFGNSPADDATGGANNTAITSGIIDRIDGNGNPYDFILFVISIGELTDANATFAVTMRAGDASNLSDAHDVLDGGQELLGTLALASFDFSADNSVRKIGYRGLSQYAELTITPSGNSAAVPACIVPILFGPKTSPAPNPPA